MASKWGARVGNFVRGMTRRSSETSSRGSPTARPIGAPSVDSTLAGATIEYNPDLDGDADPGEVVWTWVPWEEDPTEGKDRPVLIVGRRGSMLIGVPLTTKPHHNEPQMAVGTGTWDRDGRPSFAKLDRVLEVDASQVRREGSILGRRQFDAVVIALRSPDNS
jgi:PemK-like, MazF-like toxin of type II toxin-antitoxin system